MIAILQSRNPVRLNFLKTMLEDAGLHPFVFEGAAPYPGALPSRLMIPELEVELARRLIAEAEAQLGPEK